jgi:uncharacterized membrane protein (UPF0127 family)
MNSQDLVVPVAICIVAAIIVVYFLLVRGPTRKVTVTNPDGSEVSVSVEIADNPFTRAKGLMGTDTLGDDDGMLFIFDQPGIYSFWMLNTTIPLDAIFINEDGDVVDIIQMEPCGINPFNCPAYKPQAPALFVLEVNKGFSKRHGIVVGSKASP